MTATQEMIDEGICVGCGHDRWNRSRSIRGSQTTTRLTIGIHPETQYISINDYYGDEETYPEETWDEVISCDQCDYELDYNDYELAEDPIPTRVIARTHALR